MPIYSKIKKVLTYYYHHSVGRLAGIAAAIALKEDLRFEGFTVSKVVSFSDFLPYLSLIRSFNPA
jgi:hypothetical protein